MSKASPFARHTGLVEPAVAISRSSEAVILDPGEPMLISYDSIRLEYEVNRFGDKGFATSSTSHFEAKGGVTITLNTHSQVVRIARGDLVRNVPIGRVLWFGDELPR